MSADDEPTLFPVTTAAGAQQKPATELSAGQRLTIRNREKIARGIHPATGLHLTNDGQTCRTCVHARHITNGRRSWWKCEKHRLGMSRSEASDIRISWPACTLWTFSGTPS